MARRGWNRLSAAIGIGGGAVALLAAMPTLAATGHAAKSGIKWTKISSNTGFGYASPGLLRTADGRLHVIWPSRSGLTYSMHYSTVGGRAKLLATGIIEQHWAAVDEVPRLVPAKHGGMLLLMDGGNGVPSSPYNTGALYVAASNAGGRSWKLLPGSIAATGLVTLSDDAAATEPDGTPVAAWSEVSSLAYHVGIDPHSPATTPDQRLGIGTDGGLNYPTLIRTKSGTVMAGWFDTTRTAKEGYWVAQIWPSKGPKIKAPNSGGHNQNNGQPLQPVALVARQGGGDYLAYCVPTLHEVCSHVALWRVGSHRALRVPGSASTSSQLVAMSNGRGGHLWIAWFNYQTNKIRVVRTNAAATGFGQVRTINAPAPLFTFLTLSVEGSTGPLDVIALEQLNFQNATPAYFATQIDPALEIRASKARFSHTRSITITFTVVDAGDAVAGAKVTFLGHAATTNSKGQVKFTVKKGTARGKHIVVATKHGYVSANFTVRVT
jgi:hypothetical protein